MCHNQTLRQSDFGWPYHWRPTETCAFFRRLSRVTRLCLAVVLRPEIQRPRRAGTVALAEVVVAVAAQSVAAVEVAAVILAAAGLVYLAVRRDTRHPIRQRARVGRRQRATHAVVAAIGTAAVATGDNTREGSVSSYTCNNATQDVHWVLVCMVKCDCNIRKRFMLFLNFTIPTTNSFPSLKFSSAGTCDLKHDLDTWPGRDGY